MSDDWITLPNALTENHLTRKQPNKDECCVQAKHGMSCKKKFAIFAIFFALSCVKTFSMDKD